MRDARPKEFPNRFLEKKFLGEENSKKTFFCHFGYIVPVGAKVGPKTYLFGTHHETLCTDMKICGCLFENRFGLAS